MTCPINDDCERQIDVCFEGGEQDVPVMAEYPVIRDYNDLTGKPSINGVVLEGDKTSADLKIDGSAQVDDLRQELEDEKRERALEDIDIRQAIDKEAGDRQRADDELRSKIEDITVGGRPAVVDVLGSKAELDSYDTSKLIHEDIIKVLQDESHDNQSDYYRWSGIQNKFVYLGGTVQYLTQEQATSQFVPITRKINNKVLDNDIELLPEDFGFEPMFEFEIDNIIAK